MCVNGVLLVCEGGVFSARGECFLRNDFSITHTGGASHRFLFFCFLFLLGVRLAWEEGVFSARGECFSV